MTLLTRSAAVLLAAASVASVPVAASAPAPLASYSARAVNFEQPMGRAPGLVQVLVSRWSPDADRDLLNDTLVKDGQEGVLKALSAMPRAGVLRTPGTAGYPFKYARQMTSPTGEEKILIIIDRPIGFSEFRNGWQTVDYPFTVVELTLDDQGRGTGQIMAATKIEASKTANEISFEHYSAQAMLLQSVQRD